MAEIGSIRPRWRLWVGPGRAGTIRPRTDVWKDVWKRPSEIKKCPAQDPFQKLARAVQVKKGHKKKKKKLSGSKKEKRRREKLLDLLCPSSSSESSGLLNVCKGVVKGCNVV